MVWIWVAWLCASVMMVRKDVELASPHSIQTLPWLVRAPHHTEMEAIRSIVCACTLASSLLPNALSE